MYTKMLSLFAGASVLAFLSVAPGEVAARTAPHMAAALRHHGMSHHQYSARHAPQHVAMLGVRGSAELTNRHSARHAPQHVAMLGVRGSAELTTQQMDKITAGGSFTKDLTSTSTNMFNSSGNSQIQDSYQAGVGVNSHVKGNSGSLTFDNQAVGENGSVQSNLSQGTTAGQSSGQMGRFASAAGNSASLTFDNQALGKNTSVQGNLSQVAVTGQGASQTGLFVSAANR